MEKSDTEAVGWYRKAAEAGNAAAMYNLAFFYENGRGGLPKSRSIALDWYQEAAEAGVDPFQGVGPGDPRPVEQRRRHHEHRGVDEPGQAHREQDAATVRPEQAVALRGGVHGVAPAGQRGVQVDHVRHHRRPEDAGRQQHAVRPGEPGYQARHQRAGLHRDPQQRQQEPEHDDREQARHRALERPVPALL